MSDEPGAAGGVAVEKYGAGVPPRYADWLPAAAYGVMLLALAAALPGRQAVAQALAVGGGALLLALAFRLYRHGPGNRTSVGLAAHAAVTGLAVAILIPVVAAGGSRYAVIAAVLATASLHAPLLLRRCSPLVASLHLVLAAASAFMAAWLLAGADGWPAMAGAVVLATIVASVLRRNRRIEAARAAALAAVRGDAERLAGTLADLEAQGTDAIWATGADGRLAGAGPRLAEELGLPVAALVGQPLAELMAPGSACDMLLRHVREGTGFRDLVVAVPADDDGRPERWVCLSGRPSRGGGMRGTARDITAARETEARVAFMAHYDNLTGLANRHLFNERLRDLTTPGTAGTGDVAMFYLDLDDFKAINDTSGHVVGDRLLREIASRIAQDVRREDIVARLGGDEFAVLLATRAGDGLLIERAHRLLSIVRAPLTVDGQSYRVTTSIGIARAIGGDCDAEELMRRADLALYAAKRKGRDSQALFDPALDRAARERRTLEADLREAVAADQLRLHYQPIIDLDSGATTGYEALLRWQHPSRGLLAPGAFLDAAEDTGLIVPIGDWVVQEAMRELCGWPGDFRISINLSPTQVRSPTLVAALAQSLHATGIPATRVELEITEHILLDGDRTSLSALTRLRELGLGIALDDFGTGYSALGYLRRFPFDRIKIDRCFVAGVVEDASCQAIVSTITRLADALGMRTTAEGVERCEQLDLLRKLGVHEAQGYLIARPAGLADLGGPAPPPRQATGPELSSAVVDYRRARAAALRRRSSQTA